MNGYSTFVPQKEFFFFRDAQKQRQKKHLKCCTYSLSFKQKSVVCFSLAPRKPGVNPTKPFSS